MESDSEETGGIDRRKKWIRSVLLLLRDLGVAALIVAIILLSLFLYTSNWPPMVVIESKSMQHSDSESFIGVIDTGDLVLVQKVSRVSDVITYVEGRDRGHRTYGNYGDVIVYKQRGDFDGKSIIHRALLRLDWNESSSLVSLDVPDLDCEKWVLGTDWEATNLGGEVMTSPYGLNSSLILYGIGQENRTVILQLQQYIDQFGSYGINSSAFLAMGDNNNGPDLHIIDLDWIEGRARGEIPWFGLLKLTLFRDPGAPCCSGWGDSAAPLNSWDSLLISIVLIVTVPIALDFGIGYALAYFRKRKEETPSEDEFDVVESEDAETERQTEEPYSEDEESDDLDSLDEEIEVMERQIKEPSDESEPDSSTETDPKEHSY